MSFLHAVRAAWRGRIEQVSGLTLFHALRLIWLDQIGVRDFKGRGRRNCAKL